MGVLSGNIKKDIIAIGRLMWEKNLATGFNGNISCRLNSHQIAITARGSCLGLLTEKDIVTIDLAGRVIGPGHASSERMLHCDIYQNFSEINVVIHTHTAHTNGFFLTQDVFNSEIYEAKFYLGNVGGIPQKTPSVVNTDPVIKALEENNIVALKNHGVVAMGNELFDCFVLVQALEEAIITDESSRLYKRSALRKKRIKQPKMISKSYELFSKDHVDQLFKLMKTDAKLKSLGKKVDLTAVIELKLKGKNQSYQFEFNNGTLERLVQGKKAELQFVASADVWKIAFNREVSPFVLSTQKKMHLEADFVRISEWYEQLNRMFELWKQVPIK